MSARVRQIVIVGGGAAGWLTAGVLAAEFQSKGADQLGVTLIESPDVKTIGVGEGTWPSMRDTLASIGISETELFGECDASFKQGSKFAGWISGESNDYYYHPFVLPAGYGKTHVLARWKQQHSSIPFADLMSFQPHLCERGLAPKQPQTPEYAAVANYAYHLDAGKFGQLLQKHCVSKLGVRHILDHVRSVNAADNGDIASLQTDRHGALEADLFIDCTGFAALLIGGHYDVPFVCRKDVLFNDCALALQVPYIEPGAPIASQTISTAQKAGWIWDIGLPTRRGVGYVYSSAHTTDAQAEADLWDYLQKSGSGLDHSLGEPRKITLRPGHREHFWHRNCVAVGISAGFIEPLEASALALIELSAAMIRDEMPANRDMMAIAARRFNDRFQYRWDRVIEFLKLHYVLSQRRDSGYWEDNRSPETIPDRLLELLKIWRYQPPSRNDLYQIEEIFPAASYQYVLYGMGFEPDFKAARWAASQEHQADEVFADCARSTRKMLAALPTNRELIEHIRSRGLQRI